MKRLGRIPDAVWVGLVVLSAFVPTALYTQSFSTYFVMPDELGYMKQAVHIGETLSPVRSGEMWFSSYAQLVPLLFAAPYRLFEATTAFEVSHVLQAAVMSSAAIPVHRLARLVTGSRAGALVAAAAAVAVPWLAMSATLLTEPLAYVASAWAFWAMTRALAAPSPGRDVLALAALLAAAGTRTQLLILLPAFGLAVLVHEIARTRSPRRGLAGIVRGHPVLVAGAALLVLVALVRFRELLGAYSGPVEGSLFPPDVWDRSHEVLAYATVGISAVPLALTAAWVLVTLGRRDAPPAAHALAAIVVTSVPLLVLTTGSFLARYTTEATVSDRYLCFLAPLTAVGAVAMLLHARPAAGAIAAAGAGTVLLLATADLVLTGATLFSPVQTWLTVLTGRGGQVGGWFGVDLGAAGFAALSTALGCVAVLVVRRVRPGPAAGLAVAVVLLAATLVQTVYVMRTVERTQQGISQEFLASRGWLDEAVTPNRVGVVLGQVAEGPDVTPAYFWDASFWSKRADRAYRPDDGGQYQHGFATVFSIDPQTGRVPVLDERPFLLLSGEERRFGLRGQEPVYSRFGLVIVRAERPYAAAWRLTASDDTGLIAPATTATLRVYGTGRAGPQRVRVEVSAPTGATGAARVRLGDGRAQRVAGERPRVLERRVEVPARGSVALPLRAEGGPVQVRGVAAG